MADLTGWLPNLIGPLDLETGGTAVDAPRRTTINLIGMSVADNPGADRTDISVAYGTSSTTAAAGNDARFVTGVASAAVAALAIDWSVSNTFAKTIAVSSVFTFANATDGQIIVVVVTAGAGNTVTWPTVKWPSGAAPTQTSSGTDVYTFVKIGSAIYGTCAQAMA